MNDDQNSLNFTLPSMAALIAFEKAATRLSFVEAAQSLGRTPSAVSHAVRKLEEHVGVDLFTRVGKSVQLTAAGTKYAEAIRPALRELGLATIGLQRSREVKVVRISALPFFTSIVLLPNLGAFEHRNPGLQLRIETSNAFADVRHGEFDIALRFGSQRTKGLVCRPLVSVSGLPMASPSYLESAPKLEQPRDLLHHTLIHVRPDLSAWKSWLAINGVEVGEVSGGLVFDSILGALDAARNGHGVALLMDPLIRSHPSFGSTLVAPLSGAKSVAQDYNFVCRDSQWAGSKIQKTFNWLEECIGGLSKP